MKKISVTRQACISHPDLDSTRRVPSNDLFDISQWLTSGRSLSSCETAPGDPSSTTPRNGIVLSERNPVDGPDLSSLSHLRDSHKAAGLNDLLEAVTQCSLSFECRTCEAIRLIRITLTGRDSYKTATLCAFFKRR